MLSALGCSALAHVWLMLCLLGVGVDASTLAVRCCPKSVTMPCRVESKSVERGLEYTLHAHSIAVLPAFSSVHHVPVDEDDFATKKR